MNVDYAAHQSIKSKLHAIDSSFAQIARELNRSVTTVITVSQGKCASRHVEKAIALKLGSSPETLWPQRYGSGEQS